MSVFFGIDTLMQSAFGYGKKPITNPFIQLVYQKCQKASHNHSGNDIGNKMNAQINPRITVYQRPKQHAEGEPSVFEKQGEKHRQPKTVGGVAGDKAEPASPIPVYRVYQIHKIGMVGGAKTLEKRFKNGGGNLVARREQQNKHKHHEQRLAKRRFIEKQKQHKEQQRAPNKTPCYGPHNVIEENGIAAV